MRTLSEDLRLRAVRLVVEDGLSLRAVGRRLCIGEATVGRWARQYRRTGSVAARPRGNPGRSRLDPHEGYILGLIEDRADITLAEMVERLDADHGVRVQLSTLWSFLSKRGLTYKKTAHASEQSREDVFKRRLKWFERQPDLDPERLVFIDESGVSTKMARLRGRSLKGERCRAPVPHGHWKTITLVAGLRLNGVAAPALVDGAMDGETFLTWVRGMLVRELQPGDVVVMDNLPAHKVAGVREAVKAAGARVAYLPPYSPDFNPIENAFSKLKALLRKAAARTVPDLHDAVAAALDAISPVECANYFAACGYEPE